MRDIGKPARKGSRANSTHFVCDVPMQSLRVETTKGMLGAERTTIVRATLATRTHQDMSRPIPLADAGATSDPAVGEGERQSLDALFPLVYEELRRIAHRRLRGGARGQTLNTTA